MSVSRESLLKVLRDRVLARVQRGPLLDISIGKSARRFDLLDLGNDDPQRAYDGLNYVVSRSLGKSTLPILEDEEAGVSKEDADANIAVLRKIEKIKRTVSLYERETGVNPLYLAFPLIMLRGADTGGKARCILAPLSVWPLTLNTTRTQQGQVEIGFDKERGLIHENPALQPWLKERLNVEVNLEETAGKLTALDRITWEDVLTAATECLKGFQRVSLLRESAPLLAVPKKDDQIPANQLRIYSSAAVSIIDWIHQSVVADLAKLSQEAGESQLLDLFLGLRSGDREDGPNDAALARPRNARLRSEPFTLSTLIRRPDRRLDFEQNGSARLPSSTLPSPTLAVDSFEENLRLIHLKDRPSVLQSTLAGRVRVNSFAWSRVKVSCSHPPNSLVTRIVVEVLGSRLTNYYNLRSDFI